MAKKRFKPEKIIQMLREVEVNSNSGMPMAEAIRAIGVTEQTYYRWKKMYGGMKLDQAKRFKELEKENTRLKKIVADLSIDNAVLREVASGNS